MALFTLTMFLISAVSNYLNNGDPKPAQIAEKVYLHIDRMYYNSGDDIWFKAYVIDPSTNKLSFNTNNLHVELIAPDSKIIQSRLLRIESGVGNGDFSLTDSVPSGNYRIRAYTNHMRNFDDRLFFIREIVIINPSDDGQKLNRDIQYIENKIDITFFSEGGSLIDNVLSTVAFKAVNALGKGCDVTGELYSSSGDLLTTFKSTHLGMGLFTLKPVIGISYYAIVKSLDGKVAKASLPGSFPTGITISAFVTIDKKLFLTVNTNEETLPLLMDRDLALSFSLPSLIRRTTKIKITSLVNNFLLTLDDFPDGIIRVTLSEIEGLPLCERLVYLQKNSEVQLIVTTDKKEYKPREKVLVAVSLSGDSSFTGAGALSFSAAEASFTDSSSFPTSITSWFLLESDVHGPVEEPSYYFDPSNKNRLADLDLLLLTQGWRDFQWKHDSLYSFSHEIGFTITGRVKKVLNNKPVAGTNINMGIFVNKSSQFLSTETDSMGSFRFKGIDITGRADIFISATGKSERMEGRIFVDSLFYEPPESDELITNSPELVLLTGHYSVLKQEATVKLDVKKKYKLSDTIDIEEVIVMANKPETPQESRVKESRRFYGNPDKELVVTPLMENYPDIFFLIERISGVHVSRNPTDLCDARISIIGSTGPALVFLDGNEINYNFISILCSFPVSMIDRVDVLRASPLLGMRGAGGGINIITRIGMGKPPAQLSANSAAFKVNGFDAPRIFYSPKHDTPKDQAFLPDTRTTIFWEPNINIEKNSKVAVNYFNADNTTTINITVEGITEEGIPVTVKTRYNVKKVYN